MSNPDGVHVQSLTPTLDLQYARAHLPVLASIMMSQHVCRGDLIELPIPYPNVWVYTVGFVYTGQEELLTNAVKQNILYLGGKV